MPYFCISAKDASIKEAYWVHAESEQEARALVARSADEARAATDPAQFDCRPDETKTPPRRMIYRRHNSAIYIAE